MKDPSELIRGDEVIHLTSDLVKIPSENPPGEEEEAAEFVAEYLKALGFSIEIYEVLPKRPNVVARLKGSEGRPVLMLNGHLDVVPAGERTAWSFNPYSGAIKDGRVLGRGSADMKGGLAAMLVAAKTLVEQDFRLKGDLVISAVMDEESMGSGASSLVDRGVKADMAVIGEPTNLEIQRAHKGTLWLEITTRGVSGHSSRITSSGKDGPVNAVFKMAKLVSTLEDHLKTLEARRNNVVGNPTVNVGRIDGGLKVNMVPDICRIEVDRRLVPGESPEKARAEIESLVKTLSSSDPWFKAEVRVVSQREAAEVAESERVVSACKQAVKAVKGIDAKVGGFTATSDMSIFVNKGRTPTVILGPGRLEQAHVVDEYVDASQVVDAAKIYARIAVDVLG
ncbi:MAG: M20 family metallopeptidase [Thaumarchaeota archaeon]|nr:M20 family metallopeptidase [Nitrososphaerota archaeon]